MMPVESVVSRDFPGASAFGGVKVTVCAAASTVTVSGAASELPAFAMLALVKARSSAFMVMMVDDSNRSRSIATRPEIGRATSELQSLMRISYAVFCLKKKKIKQLSYNK